MTLVPVPGYGSGVLEKEGNLASYIDRLLLSGHLYAGTWDPEGLLSTIPAVATTLMGVFAGQHLKSDKNSTEKAEDLFFFRSLSVLIGLFWNFWFSINKNLWTSSYVVFTGGISLILMASCYFLIDIKKHSEWGKSFVILGTNAITVYLLAEIVHKALISINVIADNGTKTTLMMFIYKNYFASWAGLLNGSLFYALTCLFLWLGIMAILFRWRIFIKV